MRSTAIQISFLALCFLHTTSLPAQSPLPEGQQLPTQGIQSNSVPAPQPSPPTPLTCDCTRGRSYTSAYRHPFTPHALAMREAVRNLGIDRHRFVRVKLLDGRTLTGGILYIRDDQFELSSGIMGSETLRYSSLQTSPELDPAPAQHLLNGVKWTGTVAACVVLAPVFIIMLPLLATGVIQD